MTGESRKTKVVRVGPETIIDNLSLVDSNTNQSGNVFQVRFNAVGTKCTIIAKVLYIAFIASMRNFLFSVRVKSVPEK